MNEIKSTRVDYGVDGFNEDLPGTTVATKGDDSTSNLERRTRTLYLLYSGASGRHDELLRRIYGKLMDDTRISLATKQIVEGKSGISSDAKSMFDAVAADNDERDRQIETRSEEMNEARRASRRELSQDDQQTEVMLENSKATWDDALKAVEINQKHCEKDWRHFKKFHQPSASELVRQACFMHSSFMENDESQCWKGKVTGGYEYQEFFVRNLSKKEGWDQLEALYKDAASILDQSGPPTDLQEREVALLNNAVKSGYLPLHGVQPLVDRVARAHRGAEANENLLSAIQQANGNLGTDWNSLRSLSPRDLQVESALTSYLSELNKCAHDRLPSGEVWPGDDEFKRMQQDIMFEYGKTKDCHCFPQGPLGRASNDAHGILSKTLRQASPDELAETFKSNPELYIYERAQSGNPLTYPQIEKMMLKVADSRARTIIADSNLKDNSANESADREVVQTVQNEFFPKMRSWAQAQEGKQRPWGPGDAEVNILVTQTTQKIVRETANFSPTLSSSASDDPNMNYDVKYDGTGSDGIPRYKMYVSYNLPGLTGQPQSRTIEYAFQGNSPSMSMKATRYWANGNPAKFPAQLYSNNSIVFGLALGGASIMSEGLINHQLRPPVEGR